MVGMTIRGLPDIPAVLKAREKAGTNPNLPAYTESPIEIKSGRQKLGDGLRKLVEKINFHPAEKERRG